MGIIKDISNWFNRKEETEPTRKPQRIASRTIPQQLLRFNQEISNWKLGIDCFEDVHSPTSVELIRVYNDMVIDSHLTACMELRKAKTLGKDFKIIDDNGEEITEETKLLNKVWFKDMVNFALDSKFYGHSLIQFGKRIGQSFEKTELVKREYVYQQEKKVRQSPYSNNPSYPYNEGKFAAWLVEAGRCDDMGLLMKAAPLVIFKKTALSSWSQFTEMFGAPLRVGKTQVRDEALRDNMYNMLDQMGSNAFAVLDLEDTIEYIKDNQTDAYEVFDKLVERVNGEISKLFLGSTMVIDDGSSKSQAEVHEQSFGAITKSDGFYIEEWVNECVIPILNKYHGFNITGKWVYDDTEQVTKQEQFERDIEIIKTGKYNVPAEYITETYGTPVEGVEEVEESGAGELENSLKKKALSLNLDNETFCSVCNQIDSSEVPEPDWTDDYIDNLIAQIYAGAITADNLPEDLYIRLADDILGGMLNGIEKSKVLETVFDDDFVRALRTNAYQFSAAKTFQQVKEMSSFILGPDGELRNFGDYEAKAKELFGKYNRNWLRTEIAQASNSAQMASKWQEINKDKDVLPFLRYSTVGDARVRKDHAELNGVIKRVDDDFWNTFYPPNGWNCRCDVLQEAEAVETPDGDIKTPEVPDSMKINVGKQKVLFSPEHPYFIVEPQFQELKDNNFNLPIPGEVDKPKPVKLEGWSGSHRYGTLKGERLKLQKTLEEKTGVSIPDSLVENVDINLTVLNSSNEGAHYDPFKKQVYFDQNLKSYSKRSLDEKTRLVAHELGHASHFNTKELLSHAEKSPQFEKFLMKFDEEIEEISKGLTTRGRGKSKAFRYLGDISKKDYSDYFNAVFEAKTDEEKIRLKKLKIDAAAFSDTIQGRSRGNFGTGHQKSYQKIYGDLEVWAHLSENYYVGNEYFKKYLPKTYAAGLEYFENYLKRNGGL